MVTLAQRCEACKGTGRIPDVIDARSSEVAFTSGGACPDCRGAGIVGEERFTLEAFAELMQTALDGYEDSGSDVRES